MSRRIAAGAATGATLAAVAVLAALAGAFTLRTDSDPQASVILGQPNATSVAPGSGLAQMNSPSDVAVDRSGVVYVADAGNDRVLVFLDLADTVPDTVIGGATDGVGADRLNNPAGLAVWQGAETTVLFVSEAANNRVLGYIARQPGTSALLAETIADYVFGQPTFDTNVPNNDGTGASNLTAVGLASPLGLDVLDTGGPAIALLVADLDNQRVLRFEIPKALFGSPNASMDTRPDRVYGQADFASALPGSGATGLDDPVDLFATADRLYIVDQANARVVVESTGDTTWDAVYGSLGAPAAVAVSPDGATLAIADGTRVFLHADTTGAETAPDDVIGDSDLAAPAFGDLGQDARSLLFVEGLAFQRARLWAADAGNHRVLAFDGTALEASREVPLQGVAEATSSAATTVKVTPAPTDSFVQVVLSGGGTTASPLDAADSSGTGANYVLDVPLTQATDTARVYLWTSLETGAVFIALRSDTGSLVPGVLPARLRDSTETALEALRATALLVEFADSAGRLVGTLATTSDVSSKYAYTIRYDLGAVTTGRLAALGFDTSAGSGSFRFWIADAWTAPWRRGEAAVRVTAGGPALRVVVERIGTDLPGALGGDEPLVKPAGGGGACLLERFAPRRLLAPLRALRDRLLESAAGRAAIGLYGGFGRGVSFDREG